MRFTPICSRPSNPYGRAPCNTLSCTQSLRIRQLPNCVPFASYRRSSPSSLAAARSSRAVPIRSDPASRPAYRAGALIASPFPRLHAIAGMDRRNSEKEAARLTQKDDQGLTCHPLDHGCMSAPIAILRRLKVRADDTLEPTPSCLGQTCPPLCAMSLAVSDMCAADFVKGARKPLNGLFSTPGAQ